jgi:antitoxin component YwqK of YwqJK toxin-antitoxin module
MKALIVLCAFITLGLGTGCSSALGPNPKILTLDQVEQKSDGLFYEIGADELYTGLINVVVVDGIPLDQFTVINGRPTVVTSWYRNRQKKTEMTIDSSGSGSGHLTEWYENGQMRLDQDVKLDQDTHDLRPDGLVTTWYENGQMESQATYVDTKSDTLMTTWDETGQIQSQKTYVNGRVQLETTWDENGVKSTYRPAIKDALDMTRGPKAAVKEYWMDHGIFPVDNHDAGLSPGSQIHTQYVASVEVYAGVITVSFSADAGEEYSGKTLLMTPTPIEWGVSFQCSSPDLAPEVLPKQCK